MDASHPGTLCESGHQSACPGHPRGSEGAKNDNFHVLAILSPELWFCSLLFTCPGECAHRSFWMSTKKVSFCQKFIFTRWWVHNIIHWAGGTKLPFRCNAGWITYSNSKEACHSISNCCLYEAWMCKFKTLHNIVHLLWGLGLLSTVWVYLGSEFPIGGVWVHLHSPLQYLLRKNLSSASLHIGNEIKARHLLWNSHPVCFVSCKGKK